MPKKKNKLPLKDQGNQAFQRGDLDKALEIFSKAIEQEPQNPILYQNRAAVNIALLLYKQALSDCEQALKLDPGLVKSYFRKAVALHELGKY